MTDAEHEAFERLWRTVSGHYYCDVFWWKDEWWVMVAHEQGWWEISKRGVALDKVVNQVLRDLKGRLQ